MRKKVESRINVPYYIALDNRLKLSRTLEKCIYCGNVLMADTVTCKMHIIKQE